MTHAGKKLDGVIMLLLALAMAGGVVLFGGARNWAAAIPLVLCFSALTLLALRPGTEGWILPPSSLLLVLFLVYLAVRGLFFSPVFYVSKQEGLYALSYAGVFWAWTRLATSENRWRTAWVLWVFGVSLIALYALGLHTQGLPQVLMFERPAQYGLRASGTHMCPNHFAHLLAMAIITAVTLLALPRAGIPVRLVAGYGLLVMLPAFVLTQSRSGLLGLAAGLGVMLLLLAARHSRRRFLIAATALPVSAAVILTGLAGLSPVFRTRWQRAWEGDIRLRLWPDVWELIQASPVWGHGPGLFVFVFQGFRREFDAAGYSLHYAHNEYLHAAADYGLFGLLLLLAGAGIMIMKLLQLYRQTPSSSGTCIIAGLLGVIFASLVHAIFDFNFHLFGNVQVLAFVLGTGWAALYDRQVWSPRGKTGKVIWIRIPAAALAVLGLAASIQFAGSTILQARGTWVLKQAHVERARAFYQKAMTLDASWWLPYQSLGHIHQNAAFWRRDEAVRKKEAGRAEGYYLEALNRNPLDAVSYHGLARLYRQAGRYQEADVRIRRAMQLNKYNLMFKSEYGLLLKDRGHFEHAGKVFSEILEKDSHHSAARANLKELRSYRPDTH